MPNPNIDTKTIDGIDLQRPFPGLQSFQEKNKSQFGGRDIEIKELFEMVENSPLSIVFGKSGIGKTSLLLAGLIPELQQNFYLPIYVRIDYSNAKSPILQIKEFIYDRLKKQDKSVTEFGKRTLWEYFHDVKLLDGLVTPVLILDQFEETFTLGKTRVADVAELITELSDLAENRVPVVVQEDYQRRTEMISSKYGEQHYRIIISLREDYLAQLESVKKQMPSIKNNRYRVVQMTVLQAMDAAIKPGKGLIDPEIAAQIIRKIPGVTDRDFDTTAENQDEVKRLLVEPFLLSLICFQINEKRIEQKLDKFTQPLVAQFEISDVINSYYNDTVKQFNPLVSEGIENELLTESGYRKLETIETLSSKYQIDEKLIQLLVDKRIVRKEERDGVEYCELIHDVLAPVIKAKRDKRLIEIREQEKKEAIRRAVERDRMQLRRFAAIAMAILIPVISIVAYYAARNAREAKELRSCEFALKQLITARSAAENSGEYDQAAVIARTAFLIYKDNKGKDYNRFYANMYEFLSGLGVTFKTYDSSGKGIKSIACKGDSVYYGFTTGKVMVSGIKNSISAPELFIEFRNKKITSLVISPDKHYMAVAGTDRLINLIDLKTMKTDSIELEGLLANGNGKLLFINSKNELYVQSGGTVAAWRVEDGIQPILWKQHKQFEIKNGKMKADQSMKVSGGQYLSFDDIQLNGLSVYNDKLFVGADSSIILLAGDSLIKYFYPELGGVVSVQYDQKRNCIYTGSDKGVVCRFDLTTKKVEKCQNQLGGIHALCLSKDGRYLSTASWDGTVGIFDLEYTRDWRNSYPVIVRVNSEERECDTHELVWNVASSDDNMYVLAATSYGNIYKLPLKAETLSDMICENARGNLDSIWRLNNEKPLTEDELLKYACQK